MKLRVFVIFVVRTVYKMIIIVFQVNNTHLTTILYIYFKKDKYY